jgi:hypothetical protein
MTSSGSMAPSALVVAVILGLETLLAAGLTAFLIYEVFVETPDSLASALGLVAIAAMATAWIGATTVAFIRRNAFARGSALVWQVLQGAVGLASNQGLFARPDIGSGLLIPAIIVVVLVLFSKPVKLHLGLDED